MKRKTILILLVLIVATALLFLVSENSERGVKQGALTLVTPFFKGINVMQLQFKGFVEGFKTLDQLKKENLILRAENAQLRAENQTFRELEEKNRELERKLKFQESSSFRLLIARVIAREPNSWWQYVTINRGSDDGVQVDQAVVSSLGLIGKISSVTPGSAKVVLLGDENCRVSATLEGTQEQGIVVGEPTSVVGGVMCRMTFISRTASIQQNQRVFTSGLGGVFPPGLLIGEVLNPVPEDQTGGFGLYREVIIKPAAELANISDVFVVVGDKKP